MTLLTPLERLGYEVVTLAPKAVGILPAPGGTFSPLREIGEFSHLTLWQLSSVFLMHCRIDSKWESCLVQQNVLQLTKWWEFHLSHQMMLPYITSYDCLA